MGALFDTSFDRAIFALAIPALGSLIVEPLVRTAEAVMVGRLGAGTNLNLSLLLCSLNLCSLNLVNPVNLVNLARL